MLGGGDKIVDAAGRLYSFFVVRENQDNHTAFEAIRDAASKELAYFLPKAFPGYEAYRNNIRNSIIRLLSDTNLADALLPNNPLEKTDVAALSPKIKATDMDEEELRNHGVVGSYGPVDSAKDFFLSASLYTLPGAVERTRPLSNHPEEYSVTRPYINESRICSTLSGETAYYVEFGSFIFSGSMVLAATSERNFTHFHLGTSCRDPSGSLLETDNVARVDGGKLYLPVLLEKDGVQKAMTLTISSAITVFEGFASVSSFVPDAKKRVLYAYGGATEILSVLKRNDSPAEVIATH